MEKEPRKRWRRRPADEEWKILKAKRVEKNQTQEESACECGVKKQTFGDWERCGSRPAGRHRFLLGLFLGLAADELEAEIGKKFPYNNG